MRFICNFIGFLDQGNIIETIVVDEKTDIENGQFEKTLPLSGKEGVTLSQAQVTVSVTLHPDIKTRPAESVRPVAC